MQLQQGKVLINIEDEMKQSYLDYAMSVIVGRALPDVRDGLKPVHRRILYAMHELGVIHQKPTKKSARIVGEVLGKYHPHGDTAVYDAVIRMVQEFSLRYPLIDGQGNFGSIDGDSAAAMRYTEVRLSEISQELLADLEKETVGFVPNFDESLFEPTVLPSKIPNLLINGSSGIAVGMATNIPPHNLNEVIDGVIMLIDEPEVGIEEIMKVINGPDFPTAAFIHGYAGIKKAYNTGRGIIKLRARTIIEKSKRNEKESLIITELPYQVNKARLVENIASLIREKKIEGISDLRDESDRDGMRVVVELKRNEEAEVILNQLYKHTQMQTSFGIILLALVDKQPQVLNLKKILFYFIQHRREVVTRRTRYELKKAEARAHILEGLKIAVSNIDAIIKLIKESKNPGEARIGLIKKFNLTEIQAQAILEMKLQRLTGLERDKIIQEYKDILKTIAKLKEILDSEKLIAEIIKEELLLIKKKYGDQRRTEIIEETEDIELEDLIVEEDMIVAITHGGYIKRNAISLYRSQKRGGKGKVAMGTKEEDFVEHLFVASTHDYILFFTSVGKVYWLKVHKIPQAGRAAKGKAIVNLLQLANNEKITAMMPVREFGEGKFIVMATQKGIIKKTKLEAYSRPRAGGIIALTLDSDDELIAVRLTNGNQDIFLGTRNGKAIRFKEEQIRDIGRTARGVIGIKLEKGDIVESMEIVNEGSSILTITENGFGKRTISSEYRNQNRGGLGLINIKTTKRNGKVVGLKQVFNDDEIMIITSGGVVIRLEVKGVSMFKRNTQGVKLIGVREGSNVVGMARLVEKE